MGKQIWKPGNMVYPLPVVMVSCKEEGKVPNIITVAWTGTTCTNPAMVYISVRPERYSYHIIKKSKEFVINLTTEKLAYTTDFCGVKSGRDIDKFKETGLTAVMGSLKQAPMIKESPVIIECVVVDVIPLGSHHMFVAKVVAVHVDEEYMDELGKFHLSQANPIVYSHGEYYNLGNKLGTFGYSVKKTQKKARKNFKNSKNNNKNGQKR